MRELAGKNAVVTGAGSGIGRALALALAVRNVGEASTPPSHQAVRFGAVRVWHFSTVRSISRRSERRVTN